jgi:hypothetical protein
VPGGGGGVLQNIKFQAPNLRVIDVIQVPGFRCQGRETKKLKSET